MSKDETMQQALKLIERLNLHGWILADFEDEVYATLDSLKAALEQPPLPVQEPIAWLYPEGLEALQNGKCWTAYPTKHKDCNIPLYTASPQRPWVGLTEFQFAEIYNKWNDSNGSTPWGLNQALEAKLKELNK